MNWRKEAVEDLRNYRRRRQSLENMAERRRALEEAYQALRAAVSAGGDGADGVDGVDEVADGLIECVAQRERLALNIAAVRRLVRLTERGLNSLDDRQRLVLERFYIEGGRGHAEWLMERLACEKSRVYELKDEALYAFTTAMYGLAES